MRHAVVLSDVHLWEPIEASGLWMRYRHRSFFPDARIAGLIDRLLGEIDDGTLDLVFDGDLFDFDVPSSVDARTAPPRDAAASVRRLDAIVATHGEFMEALGRVLLRGHRLVFVAGNHDVQLSIPWVRARLVEHLVAAAVGASTSDADSVRARIVFRAWFHRTEAGVHIEHGNQYDPYCSVRYPMEPFTRDGARLQPTLGSLVMQHLVGRLGYFNPNVDSSFLLTTREYLQHWVRYYLFTRRSLAGVWAVGSLRVVLQLLLHREPVDPSREGRQADIAATETGADRPALRAHARLFSLCSLRRSARLLRADRIVTLLIAALVAMIAIADRRVALVTALCIVGGALAYVRWVPQRKLAEVYDDVHARMSAIARLHGARAVVFGHTHQAFGRWEHGVFYGNCGTWAPMFRDVACTEAIETAQPFVWLRSDGGRLEGGLYRYADGNWRLANEPMHDERGRETAGASALSVA